MPTGTIRLYVDNKSIGFIVPDAGGMEVRVMIDVLQREGISSLTIGQKVEYTINPRRTGALLAETLKVL